jgi:hypothetical protein
MLSANPVRLYPRRRGAACVVALAVLAPVGAASAQNRDQPQPLAPPKHQRVAPQGATVAASPTAARAADGTWISWREHLIDDRAISGVPIEGGDGLAIGDLDRDGHLDVVAVFESDTVYDEKPLGHIRVAFGSDDPARWEVKTLAEGAEAAGAEDVAIGDVDADGWPDVVVACELAHLLYLENPGENVRTASWARVMPGPTKDRGSYIRVTLADLNSDGRLEVVTPNKGGQNPPQDTKETHAISWFDPGADPLTGEWTEHELTRVRIPINAQVVDLDRDRDLDIVGGSRGEQRIFWFENQRDRDFPPGIGAPSLSLPPSFTEHRITIDATALPASWRSERYPELQSIEPPLVTGFAFAFADLSGDGRIDIVLDEGFTNVAWLEQPGDREAPWKLHPIGTTFPDHVVGLTLADVDGDGALDLMTGGYSWGSRERDEEPDAAGRLGRIAWFRNPGKAGGSWTRHDVSRRQRGMFDQFVARDLDRDGDVDFLGTRGNSEPYDGLFWLEQTRSPKAGASFEPARERDSPEVPLPSQALSAAELARRSAASRSRG